MRIFLDMDEVLCDFVGGACRASGVSPRQLEACWEPGLWDMIPPLGRLKGAPLSNDDFWATIDGDPDFWASLQPLPWMSSIIEAVSSVADEWYVLSSPSRSVTSHSGKVRWLKAAFGQRFDRFILTRYKHLFAGPETLLIDDREDNVTDFIAAGGQGILFPRHHNSLHAFKADPVTYVRRELEKYHAYQVPQRQRCVPSVSLGYPLEVDPDQAV